MSGPSRPGPLWGAPNATPSGFPQGPPPLPPIPEPLPPRPDPRGSRRRATALYVVVSVCLLGGILAIAIVRYSNRPAHETAAAPVTTTAESAAPEPAAEAPVTTTPPPTTTWTPPSTSLAPVTDEPVPPSYRTVSGPGGVHVAIPADWQVKPGAVPSNLQADAPDGTSLIRFGGSAAEPGSLLDTVASNETENPNIVHGYLRLRLEPVVGMGVEAVNWEFEFVNKDGVQRHSYGRYWRLNGIDYVVYASTDAALWDTMTETIEVMVSTAGPV